MSTWGRIRKVSKGRSRYAVEGIWQEKKEYISQMPVGDKFRPLVHREDADFVLQEIRREIDRGIFRPERYKNSNPLSFENWSKRWLKDMKSEVGYVTWKGYRSYIENHLNPFFGPTFLPDINYPKLAELYRTLPVSDKSKQNIFGCLHKILRDAKRCGFVTVMPEWITIKDTADEDPHDIEWMRSDAFESVLSFIRQADRYIFRFLRITGVRPSEARALQKRDLYPEDGYITIRHAFAPVGKGEALKRVKNKKAQKIPFYADLVPLFHDMPGNLTPWVFLYSKTGKHYSKNINRDIWNPACVKALGHVFPLNHAGRHSFGNELALKGVPLETIGKLLRHTDPRVTEKHYANPSLEAAKTLVENVRKI